jgi:inorganic triphosphatase YgiF
MNMMNTEIELKLRVDPDDLSALAANPVLVAASASSEHLHAVYFDTSDHRLHARSLSLRVRREGEQFIQTLKVGDAGPSGLHRRKEWETPVRSDKLDLGKLPNEVVHNYLYGIAETDLVPVFETIIERTIRQLEHGDAADGVTSIEVAIDRGEIRAGDVVLPVAEIELELKLGPAQALFDLALELAAQQAVRVETRSKAARGYALASDRSRCAVKAGRLEIDPNITGDDALAGIIRHCIGHMIANEACVAAGVDPEGIHQMRVALRRLRSALVLFRSFVPAEQYDWLNTEVKWLAGTLGNARDWDAYTAALLAPVRSSLPDAPELQALAVTVETARRTSYKVTQDAVGSTRYTILLLRMQAWLEARAWRNQDVSKEAVALFRPVTDLAGKLLSKRHRSVCKRGHRFEALAHEERHEVRKELKKLRYAVEFFQNLYAGKRLKRYLERLEALQEDLGHLNDVATARVLTERLKKENPKGSSDWRIGCGIVMGWHTQAAGILEPRLIEHWQDFSATKPFWK